MEDYNSLIQNNFGKSGVYFHNKENIKIVNINKINTDIIEISLKNFKKNVIYDDF